MFTIKTYNKISAIAQELLGGNYAVSEDAAAPEAVMLRSQSLHEEVFNPELLAIARAGAGVNNIPCERCVDEGIVVFNTPGANANAVKELVIAGMLAASRNLIPACDWAKTLVGEEGVAKLVEKGKKNFVGREIRGKTLGVIGLGAIGVLVANDCSALGMDVIGYDPFISIRNAWNLQSCIRQAESLEELVEKSDYISIHVPLVPETKGYINADLCALMKKGTVLLNFSRADLVDFSAVKAALADGRLAQYVVDFPTEETIGQQGVLAIPHLGASTPESEENCARMAAMELREYLEKGNIINSVNMPNCALPVSGAMRICVINESAKNAVGAITSTLADKGANIVNMVNASRGNVTYTIMDIDQKMDEAMLMPLCGLDGIRRVRFIYHG